MTVWIHRHAFNVCLVMKIAKPAMALQNMTVMCVQLATQNKMEAAYWEVCVLKTIYMIQYRKNVY